MSDCNKHPDHTHQHGPDCGHTAVKHGDHVDYLHDGHLHHPHGDHVDEHTIEVSTANPDACTPDPAAEAMKPGMYMDQVVGTKLYPTVTISITSSMDIYITRTVITAMTTVSSNLRRPLEALFIRHLGIVLKASTLTPHPCNWVGRSTDTRSHRPIWQFHPILAVSDWVRIIVLQHVDAVGYTLFTLRITGRIFVIGAAYVCSDQHIAGVYLINPSTDDVPSFSTAAQGI